MSLIYILDPFIFNLPLKVSFLHCFVVTLVTGKPFPTGTDAALLDMPCKIFFGDLFHALFTSLLVTITFVGMVLMPSMNFKSTVFTNNWLMTTFVVAFKPFLPTCYIFAARITTNTVKIALQIHFILFHWYFIKICKNN